MIIMTVKEAKESVAGFMARCYQRGLTTATGGNISMRFDDLMLITPSGKDKASLSSDDIAEVRLSDGMNLTPDLRLSIESDMHRRVYLKRPDVNAVVHSHPVFSCLYSASDRMIDTTLIAESWYLLDKVIKVPYALMGTEELARRVGEFSEEHDVMLLENHGAIAFGKTLINAFDRLECLEQAARLTYLSESVPVKGLSEARCREISELR